MDAAAIEFPAALEIVPPPARQVDRNPPARPHHRGGQQVAAQHVLPVEGPCRAIVWKGQRHGSHHRQAGGGDLGHRFFEVRQQAVAEFQPSARDALGFVAEIPRLTRADAMDAGVRGKHARLDPPHVEFRIGRAAVKAADVMA